MASLREHGEEAAPLLEGRARSSTSRYASRVVLASALAVFGVLVLASASPQGVGARLGGSERPSSRVFLGQAKELNATSVIDELEKALPLSDEAVDLTESVQPFIAMEGCSRDSWSQNWSRRTRTTDLCFRSRKLRGHGGLGEHPERDQYGARRGGAA